MKRKMVMAILAAATLTFTACQATSNTTATTSGSIDIVTESVLLESGSDTVDRSADLTDATYLTVESGQDITIDSEGTYVLSGTATDAEIIVDAGDDEVVELILDGLNITNSDKSAICVLNAGTVSVTLSESSTLKVTGEFAEDEETNANAVIYSKTDLILGGTGTLTIESTDAGVKTKDNLKVNGGTLVINAEGDGLHATETLVIDDGELNITAAEGIESTVVRINGGNITIEATDDGINASQKSDSYSVLFEMNDGYVKITMAQGDTDGIDSNGDIVINGGTIDVSGQSCFDYDGTCEFNGGTIIENGEEVDTITNQFAGGGMGGPGGEPGEMGAPGEMGGPGGGMGGPGNGGQGGPAPEGFNLGNN